MAPISISCVINEDWTPLGHEVVGVIEEVGEGVGRFQGGERVIVENHAACGVCKQCKNGRSLYCENLTTYMEDQAGFSDYLVVRSDMMHCYNGEQLKLIHACLAEPLTVAIDVTLRAPIPNSTMRWSSSALGRLD